MTLFRILIFVAIVGICHACSEPIGWEPKSIKERASMLQWIVYGTVVTDQMPAREGGDTVQESVVIFQPLCWLKRGAAEDDVDLDAATEFESITVLEEKLCVANELVKGRDYVLFLSKDESSHQFVIVNVNVEPGALEPTDKTFLAVYRGIDTGLEGDPEGECVEGVEIPCFTGEADPNSCNLGVALKMTLWSMIVGVALAVTAF